MADMFQDVDDALRQENAQRLWQTYGPYAIIGALVLILATGAITGYRAWDKAQNEESTTRLMAALEKGDSATLEQSAEGMDASHAAIARMSMAGKMAQDGKPFEAAALYKEIYASGKTPGDIADLARIYYVRATLSSGKDLDGKELVATLSPVAEKEGSPWTVFARLDSALVEATVNGNPARAVEILDTIKTAPGASQTAKDRAAALREIYAMDLKQDGTNAP